MLQLSIFAYALGGAALSFAYFELFYAIIALLIVLEARILPAALAAAAANAAAAAAEPAVRPDNRMPAPAMSLRSHQPGPTL
jgi:predicted lipid-binding transport protein (Tim44 family)